MHGTEKVTNTKGKVKRTQLVVLNLDPKTSSSRANGSIAALIRHIAHCGKAKAGV
jgi:hypothetical protein